MSYLYFIYVIKIYVHERAELKMRQWKSTLTLRTCHGCVYTGSFEHDYPHTLLAALHVHRIEIPFQAFPEWFGPRIL